MATGIAPKDLYDDSAMLATLLQLLEERGKR